MLLRCLTFFTARRYASAVYVVALGPSVWLSVTSRKSIETAKISPWKWRYTTAYRLYFSIEIDLEDISTGHPQRGRQIGLQVHIIDYNRRFSTNTLHGLVKKVR